MAEHHTTFELFYDGAWHPAPVLTRSGLKYKRGTDTPGGDTDPAEGTMTLDNGSGDYAPKSALSHLRGKIGQNTKGRLSADSDVRMTGEVAAWKPKRPVKGSGSTPIELAGVLRRIGRGKDPLRSALYRAMVALGPVAYWPMEDGTSATVAASGLSDTNVLTPAFQTPAWSNDSGLPGSAPLPQLVSSLTSWTTILTGNAQGQSTTAWSVSLWFKSTMDTSPTGRVIRLIKWGQNPTNSDDPWTINIFHSEPTATYSVGVDFSAYILVNTGPDPFDGNWHHIVVRVEQNGADLDIYLRVDSVLLGVVTTTTPDYTLKPAGEIAVLHNPGFVIEATSVWMGHVGFFDRFLSVDEITTLYQAGLGYVGETAADRFSRLCLEEGITGTVVGVAADSAPMGAQGIATLLDHFDEMARTDDASIFETRDDTGLTFRTGPSKMNQAPDLTVSYLGQIEPTLTPVFGDTGIRNDVTGRNPSGSTRRVFQPAGYPHNVELPEDDPQGVGRYQTSVDVNTSTDAALGDVAGWRVNLGTFDGTWYAEVTVDLDAAPGLIALVNALDIGDVLAISDLPEDEALDAFEGLIIGIEEDLPPKRRLVTFHLVPNDPYRVGLLALTSGDTDPFLGHLDTDDSTTHAPVSAGASSFQVDVNAGPLWTTDSDDFPFDIIVGGQRVSIASISGASSPQTFNVRSAALGGRQVLYPIDAGASIVVQLPIILVP